MSSKAIGKKIFLSFILLLLVLVGAFLIFLAYAIRPAVTESQFSSQAIIKIFDKAEAPLEHPTNLTVVSYNIGYASGDKNNVGDVLTRTEVEENLATIAKALKPLQPDLVFLQEVDFASHRSFEINQLEVLAKALDLPYGAYAVTWNKKYIAWPYWPFSRHFGKMVSGQAVLSRYPLSDQKIEMFPRPDDNPFWYNWFYLDRLIESLVVHVGATPVHLLNVHLEAFSEKNKGRQIQGIARFIQGLPPGPKILAGDFNLVWVGEGDPEEDMSAHHSLLENLTKDTGMTMAGWDHPKFTFPSWKPKKKIDYIFFSPDLSLERDDTLLNVPASDHLPIWARLRLP